uniref:zinc finger protein 239-like n=1 Tax=Myxine glutinosa TaxID=7769 RepID=UPI00358F5C39
MAKGLAKGRRKDSKGASVAEGLAREPKDCWETALLIRTRQCEGLVEDLTLGLRGAHIKRRYFYYVHGRESTEYKRETAPSFMNSADKHPQDSLNETNKRTFYKQEKLNEEMFAENNFHEAHNGKKGEHPCKCTSCGKYFNRSSTLKAHMRIHNGERPYKCTSCGNSFNRPFSLKTHMRIHNGERPHKCTICGKSFRRSSHLKTHMRIHNGERPYECTICGKCCSQSYNLKIHMRIHNGERPYKCTSCGKAFNQSSSLRTHIGNHNVERPYKCTICGKSFNRSSFLKRHIKIHNGERR